MKSQLMYKLVFTFLCIFFTTALFAQLQLPKLPGAPENAPVDGGLSLLIAAGAGYGAKKLRKRKANQNENSPSEK